jgi:hypothetical protein
MLDTIRNVRSYYQKCHDFKNCQVWLKMLEYIRICQKMLECAIKGKVMLEHVRKCLVI